jgi:K+-sensing histidine kinase KdpD
LSSKDFILIQQALFTGGKIFQKFEIGTVQQNTTQIGLGLAFCKMAVEAQGGTLTLSPNQPQGSIFTVEI